MREGLQDTYQTREKRMKDGGFIMDASTGLDDAKPENIKAMFEFTKEYGLY